FPTRVIGAEGNRRRRPGSSRPARLLRARLRRNAGRQSASRPAHPSAGREARDRGARAARHLRRAPAARLRHDPPGLNDPIMRRPEAGMRLMWAVRRNSYFDSIDLMRVAEQARQLGGVADVAVVMGTAPGRAMLAEAGMWPSEAPEGGPSDLLIAVRAATEAAGERALASVEELLQASRTTEHAAAEVLPRTTAAAARRSATATVALVAVPGPYAAVEAHQALSSGLHVFLFSDGVPLDDEIALKRRGRTRGLLVMGPECGTAIVNGVGLGFANRVRRGPIGVVGASGTGIQELTTVIHRLGAGVSHA